MHPHTRCVRVLTGDDSVIVESRQAIELREVGYEPVQYLPREDVRMDHLQPTDKITHCPYKGDTVYFSIELPDLTVENAAWSYEYPYEPMRDIAGRLAFDTRLVQVEVGGEMT